MQLVLEISEAAYLDAKHHSVSLWSFLTGTEIQRAIRNGTVLPEKHGRLIDADRLDLGEEWRNVCINKQSLWIVNGILKDAPTIIEATEEQE